MSWVVSQIGARQHYAVPLGLARQGELLQFFSDFWIQNWVASALPILPTQAFKRLWGRHNPELGRFVRSFNLEAATARLLCYGLRKREDVYLGHLAYGKWYDRKVASCLERMKTPPRFVFTFNTGALETLDAGKRLGSHTIVDQIDAAQLDSEIVQAERDLFPGWELDPPRIPEAYWTRLKNEWATADTVLVNSEFSRASLIAQGVSPEKLVVVPLAYEKPSACNLPTPRREGALRVLYLGGLSLRKGIQYLAQAARKLPDIQFDVAGPSGLCAEALRSFPPNLRLHGYVPRIGIHDLFRRAEVFVLPTLSDGFAITQLEAMAWGLPVIATDHCGRVVSDGHDGFVVPVRNSDAIVDALLRLDRDRELLTSLGRNAFQTVDGYSLDKVTDQLIRAISPSRGGINGPSTV